MRVRTFGHRSYQSFSHQNFVSKLFFNVQRTLAASNGATSSSSLSPLSLKNDHSCCSCFCWRHFSVLSKKFGPFQASFFLYFVFSTVNRKYVHCKILRWLDSNRGPLVLEATALPTEPQPLPNFCILPSLGRPVLFVKWILQTFKQVVHIKCFYCYILRLRGWRWIPLQIDFWECYLLL